MSKFIFKINENIVASISKDKISSINNLFKNNGKNFIEYDKNGNLNFNDVLMLILEQELFKKPIQTEDDVKSLQEFAKNRGFDSVDAMLGDFYDAVENEYGFTCKKCSSMDENGFCYCEQKYTNYDYKTAEKCPHVNRY